MICLCLFRIYLNVGNLNCLLIFLMLLLISSLSVVQPCHLSDELLMVVFQHQSLVNDFIDKKEADFFAYSWCYMPINLYLPSFDLVRNITVDGCNFYWTHLNKGWRILFWSSCCQACCNILDAGFCDLRVVLQWEYKSFMVILELHKVIVNHQTPDVVTFW